MVKAIIAPSMLSSDFANLASEAEKMLHCGADWLHMDIMVITYSVSLILFEEWDNGSILQFFLFRQLVDLTKKNYILLV